MMNQRQKCIVGVIAHDVMLFINEYRIEGEPGQLRREHLTEQFLRASAMLKHVKDIGWTSVCPSVRLSVTR